MSKVGRSISKIPVVGGALKAVYRHIERRKAAAMMMDRQALHAFWQTPAPEGNVPEDYLKPEDFERSEILLQAISFLPKDARILEVGCNAGRNLVHLWRAGFKNLEGIEISPHAVQLLRDTFPELDSSPIHVGAAEDLLSGYPDCHFHLVFTMAVLEHIHPDSETVFDNIARIARHIVAVEPTDYTASIRQYPHDVKNLFETRGYKLVQKQVLGPSLPNFSLYRFDRR